MLTTHETAPLVDEPRSEVIFRYPFAASIDIWTVGHLVPWQLLSSCRRRMPGIHFCVDDGRWIPSAQELLTDGWLDSDTSLH
jgi:hypothetical protein